jgi:hypothetical protein
MERSSEQPPRPIKKTGKKEAILVKCMGVLSNIGKKKKKFHGSMKPPPSSYDGDDAAWCALSANQRMHIRAPGWVPGQSKKLRGPTRKPPPSTYDGDDAAWRALSVAQRISIRNPAKAKQWYSDNKLKQKAYNARHYTMNKAKHNASVKAYSAKNKDQINASQRQRNKTNKYRTRIIRTAWKTYGVGKARLRAYQALPATKERLRVRNKARASRVNAIEKEYVADFLRMNPDVQPKSHLITDTQIEGMLMKLLDSRNPKIIGALQGFTLREAFVDRKLYASLYVWLARGTGVDKRPGQNYAEAERFLVRDPNPILSNAEAGKHYTVGNAEYKQMGLVTIPLASFDTASACSKFESRMQNFFDFRRYGMEKLWKKAGAGKLYQKYRRCDIAAMQKTGSNSLVYTCGITVLPGVRMASCNSANVLTSIRSGEEGILSKVNQPARWAATWARDQHMFGLG